MSRISFDPGPVIKVYRKAAFAALTDAGESLLEGANRTAPIEEAVLIGSGQVSGDERALSVAVSYDTPYAVRQHEDTTMRHDPGRRAKWLERTFAEQATQVGKYLAERMRRLVR